MTKQEAIEKTKKMLEILIGLPDSENIDIVSADANEYSSHPGIRILLSSGIEDVEKSIENPVVKEHLDSDNDIRRRVQSENFECEYVQIFLE